MNVLLNIAQTALHRQCLLALHDAGLLETIGVFHVYRPGHPVLASDLQEPFRHLMDLTTLYFLRQCPRDAFSHDPDGPFRLRIRWPEARRFAACIQETLARACRGPEQTEPYTYREQIWMTARRLKAFLLGHADTFTAFEHP